MNHHHRHFSLRVVIATLLILQSMVLDANPGDTPVTSNGGARPPPSIAILDESIEWATSREATDRIISQLVALGVTTYIPCVWHGRGTYYPSLIAKPDTRVLTRIRSGDDPLQYLLDTARQNNIKVHVWYTVVKREDDNYPQFFRAGTPKGAYDIHIPAFRRFITDLILEVVDKYNVDGINLDYIRSMGLCTSDACIESYRDFAQADLLADSRLRRVPAIRERIEHWNEAVLRDILIRIRSGTKGKIEVSVDGHSLNRHTELQGQFPVDWSNSGLIDRIYDIRYSWPIAFEEIDTILNKLKQPQKFSILLSNANNVDDKWVPRTGIDVVSQIRSVSQRWPDMQLGLWHRPRITTDQQDALEALLKP